MGRTITRTDRRERDGYIVYPGYRRPARRLATRSAIVRAELAIDRPAVRAALKGATR